MRVRFAPSPTGPLHIGGVRTALYNYLLARKHGGRFILRIEDTDQTRYVPGAEEYILETLEWLGLLPDEGPRSGGKFGPYRQSERKSLYADYAQKLLERGHAYYAFDTPEELEARRLAEKEKGNHTFKYDARIRLEMTNSLTLPPGEVERRLSQGQPHTIRMKVPQGETIIVEDLIRGRVEFQSAELDDKILLKSDGMPTYHLANIVDDHLMQISHVVRGEEWLPSTAHHVLLYRFFGWEAQMPRFAHLPLILKPSGKGKLSKRDGAKLGIPVFPLSWDGEDLEDRFEGFRERGFLPEALLNFLAFLGWNPGTEQEIFSLQELAQAFSIEQIGKAGARFDYDKALWFNQQYLLRMPNEEIAARLRPLAEARGYQTSVAFLTRLAKVLKERVHTLNDFFDSGYYFFEPVKHYDEKAIRKRWKPERRPLFLELSRMLEELPNFQASAVESTVKDFMERHGLGFGDVLPILRLAWSGTLKGPGVFDMAELLGQSTCVERLRSALDSFDDTLEVG